MSTLDVIAAVLPDLYAAEWAAFYAAMEATLPPRESQTDPADDADGYGPDGLTDGERGYREATDEATRERLAAVCRDCNDSGQCSECHGTNGYPAATCPACSGSGECPFCNHKGGLPC